MRIGVITPGFSASEDDWCIPVLLNLVREMAREHDVQVFTLRYPHRDLRYNVAGATVHAFGGAKASGARRMMLLQRAFRTIQRESRTRPFDVLHGFWTDEPGFLAAMVGRVTGTPSVVSIMGGELIALPEIGYGGQIGIVNPRLTSLALRFATCVTAGSIYIQQFAMRHSGITSVRRLPLGVDTARFKPPEGHDGPAIELTGNPAIISVGSLSPVKNHSTLLEAIAHLKDQVPAIHVHLVGDGPLRDELGRRADSLGIGSRLTLHGEVEHHDLPALYRAADLLVVASLHESQCLAALEAAACGCPVLGTAVGILPEISPPSQRIPPGDHEALAAAIRTITDRTARRDELRDLALHRARTEFSLDRTVQSLLDIYREIGG